MKVTAVELAEIPDTDSKEEQDTATAVDNICNERIPSELMYCITYHGHSHEFVVLSNYTSSSTRQTTAISHRYHHALLCKITAYRKHVLIGRD